jgi:hypothetical protein
MQNLRTYIVHDIPSSQSVRANIEISNEIRMVVSVSNGAAVPASSLCKVSASRLSCVSRFETLLLALQLVERPPVSFPMRLMTLCEEYNIVSHGRTSKDELPASVV